MWFINLVKDGDDASLPDLSLHLFEPPLQTDASSLCGIIASRLTQ